MALIIVLLSPWAVAIGEVLPPCPFHLLTGVPCLGCGSGRAALALAHFDIPGAFVLNPLAALGWIVLVGGGLGAGLLALVGREPPTLPNHLRLGWRLAALGVLALNWAFLIWVGR